MKRPFVSREELCVRLGITSKDLDWFQKKWKLAKPLNWLEGEKFHVDSVRNELRDAGFPC